MRTCFNHSLATDLIKISIFAFVILSEFCMIYTLEAAAVQSIFGLDTYI
jgi:hypothetical protein